MFWLVYRVPIKLMFAAFIQGPMRFGRFLFWALVTASFLSHALAQEVTISQLRSFLMDQGKSKHPDDETANRLSSISLSERLTDQALNRIVNETNPGPESVEQLRLLGDYSIFAPPPSNESPVFPAPEREAQEAILRVGEKYAQGALQHLPDFLAIRDTRRFDNTPQTSGTRRTKPKIRLHWIGEFKDQITYRNGAEIAGDSGDKQIASAEAMLHPGLLSMGEFGPILAVVFSDLVHGDITWARWEMDSIEGRLAVFRYNIPKTGSHYLVDFCCYTRPEDETREFSFRDHPAYHGEVVLSPDSGVVRRITIEADLDSSAPIMRSDLAVQFGEVEIGGRSFVCPVRSVAMTEIHNHKMERVDGVGIERHLNVIQYRDYHKFGSSSRMITNP
jgi:hypothetical protein